uniref:RFX1-4/6/8-like BCD domain-containing protein n=1 Tax=Hucho hucho TaxID=62062 RepID=A0A4W5L1U9_9TELE
TNVKHTDKHIVNPQYVIPHIITQQCKRCPDASRVLPEFPELDLQDRPLPDGIIPEHITAFQQLYREHCEAILDVMVNLQFTLVETLWKTFWRFSESIDADTLGV